MSYKTNARLCALFISFLYIGLGCIQLTSIFTSNGQIFSSLGETFQSFIMPSFILGFGLGYAGGVPLAVIGQSITFALCYFILYGLFLLLFKMINSTRT